MRFLPLQKDDRAAMLAAVGIDSIDSLFSDVPSEADGFDDFNLPSGADELSVERHMQAYADDNVSASDGPFFLGAGAYRHHVPAVVDHLIQRSEFLTAYTPYQPEISQGTLQCLFEFQTQVAQLTGMDVANASMYDGSTAAAEAVLMAERVTRRSKIILSAGLHPQYASVIRTMTAHSDAEIIGADFDQAVAGKEDLRDAIDEETACVVVQYPDVFGHAYDLTPVSEAAHEAGALLIAVCTEVVALGLMKSPGEMGADIVAAEGQSIGVGLNFGGPYLGLFATRQHFVRQMPGRLCGQTVDADGRRGFVLTLSTREQHIRREKATSNICTNSGLCALAFTIHMSLLGETGLRRLACINHASAVEMKNRLGEIDGVTCLNKSFFNEICLRIPTNAGVLVETLADRGILGGVPMLRLSPDEAGAENLLLVAATEMTSAEDIEALALAIEEALGS